MRLVILVHEFPKASEAFLVDKFLGLCARGVDVHLVAEQESPEAWALYPALRSDGEIRARIHAWPRRSRPFALGAMALRESVQAFVHSPKRVLQALVRAFAHHLTQVPGRFLYTTLLIRLRPDILHFEFGSLAANRIDLARWIAPRTSVSIRGWDVNYFALETPEVMRRVFERVDRVHFIGEDLRLRALRRGLLGNVPSTIIRPAVDTSKFRPEEKDRRQDTFEVGTLRVLAVGRLHWKKGYEFALHAMRRVLDSGERMVLRIAGDGPFEAAVQACIADLDLGDRVVLLGAISREEVKRELSQADVFLHAAVSEGFCNGVLEAQAMGLPVVCSDADGLRENLSDGVTGIVVPRRNPGAMAEALLRLARDPQRRERLGSAGPSRVREHFSSVNQIDEFVRLYEDLFKSR